MNFQEYQRYLLISKKTKYKNCADFVLVKRNTVLQIHNVLVMTRGLTYQKVMRKKCVGRWKKVFSAFQRLIWPLTLAFESYHLAGLLKGREHNLHNFDSTEKCIIWSWSCLHHPLESSALQKKVWFIHSIHTYISSDFTEDEGNQGDIVEALTPNHLQMAALVCCVSISLFWRFSRP